MRAGALHALTASPFARAVALLAGGQGIAALLPIAAAPVLGRLYRPAEYGALAAYMAVATIFAAASALQLQHAIIAERSERRAIALVSACAAAGLAVSLPAAAAALLLFNLSRRTPDGSGVSGLLLLLPMTTVVAATIAGIAALANRRARYGFAARAQIVPVAAGTILSIAFGLADAGADGLFAAYFLQQAATLAVHLVLLRGIPDFRWERRTRRLVALVRRHRRFAFFTLPTEFVGALNQSLPALALSSIGAAGSLGAFNRARALALLPFTLIGSAVAQVFRQSAAAQFHTGGSCRPLYARTLGLLAIAGAAPTLVLMLFAPTLFRVVLGPNWTEAGELARILAPMAFLKLIANPLATIFHFQELQREDFIISATSMALLAAAFTCIWSLGAEVTAFVYAYAVCDGLMYIAYLVRGWLHSAPLATASDRGRTSCAASL